MKVSVKLTFDGLEHQVNRTEQNWA